MAGRKDWEARMKQLATEFNHPLRVVRELVGEAARVARKRTLWNVFQVWYGHEGEREKDKDNTKRMTASLPEWNRFVRAEFERELENIDIELRDNPEQQEKHFAPMVKWYEEALMSEVNHLKAQGKFGAPVQKVASQAYNNLGLHVFGFTIDIDDLASMLWGGSLEYSELRVEWSSSVMAQLRNYEAMFRTISIRKRSGLSGPLGNTPLVYLTRHANESDCDFARRLFVQFFIRDLTGTLAAGATITMNWDIAELAVRCQVRVVNWPPLTSPPTVGWKAPSEFLAAVMPLLQERHQYQNDDDDVDDDDVDDPDADSNSGEEMDAAEKAERKAARQAEKQAAKVADAAKAPRIERWTQEERELDLEEQGDIAVLTTTDDKDLLFVRDGKTFKRKIEAIRVANEPGNAKPPKKTKKAQKSAAPAPPALSPPPTRVPAVPIVPAASRIPIVPRRHPRRRTRTCLQKEVADGTACGSRTNPTDQRIAVQAGESPADGDGGTEETEEEPRDA
ncbi:hypothetical protein B0H17DRAFT_1126851 [Mycena rosella]|uniref:Uncharacterized protein n=1 Tax=Mycena rosella TaxID=1033263 RepID=A0AAD7GSU9_MYCRO|nr:hypothetical protein B0H17DRAFT_1126851 [Mycena rosella]